jgi:hypothetical protein
VAVGFVFIRLSDVAASSKLDLDVLYLGEPSDARTTDFNSFLSDRFANVRVMNPAEFAPNESDADFDVLLLDWHQGEGDFPPASSFLGDEGELRTPAVLLGSAGLLHAVASEVRGGFG